VIHNTAIFPGLLLLLLLLALVL